MKFFYGTISSATENNTSTLKTFYNALTENLSFTRMTSLISTSNAQDYKYPSTAINPTQQAPFSSSQPIRHVIVIISCAVRPIIAKQIMRQLHFMIPTSATKYHLQSQCKPLFKGGILYEVEPSPSKSRSRNLRPDPGTRVEITWAGQQYRRIGDDRLTFIQLEQDILLDVARWKGSELKLFLLEKVSFLGYIFMNYFNFVLN
jgi:hypothetical protein